MGLTLNTDLNTKFYLKLDFSALVDALNDDGALYDTNDEANCIGEIFVSMNDLEKILNREFKDNYICVRKRGMHEQVVLFELTQLINIKRQVRRGSTSSET